MVIQEEYDEFATKLGIKALRSNSIFTTTSVSQAISYGRVYVIFPFNSDDFSWSQTHRDIVLQPSSNLNILDLKAFQQVFKLDQTDLDAALKSGHEILVHGTYIAIRKEIYEDMLAERLI